MGACVSRHVQLQKSSTSCHLEEDKMAAEELAKKTKTQFDLVSKSITNIAMGAPSDALLKKCAELLKDAAKHRMVRNSDVT